MSISKTNQELKLYEMIAFAFLKLGRGKKNVWGKFVWCVEAGKTLTPSVLVGAGKMPLCFPVPL